MNEVISVIIPVYNTEQYIEKCLESLREQSYDNFQAILVDDGSKDGSGEICDRYSELDSRFKAIHKENAGPSKARNYGLDIASGDYVFFLDSDDYLSKNAFQIMIECINGTDLVCCAYMMVDEKENVCDKQFSVPEGAISRKEMLHLMLYEDEYGFVGYISPKLFKNEIIQRHHIRFEESIKHNEDRLFVTSYVLYGANVNWCSDVIYFYRQRENSLVHSVGPSNFSRDCLHELFGFEKMKELFEDEYKDEWFRTSRLIFEKSLFWYRIIPQNMKQEKEDNLRMLNENFQICLKDKNQSAVWKIKTGVHWLLKR